MAYPRVTVPAVRGYPRKLGVVVSYLPNAQAHYRRQRISGYSRPVARLGQSLVDDIGSLFTPNPGGGSVTVDGTTTYVNSAGEDQSTLDPNAGQSLLSNPLSVISEDVQGVAASTPGLDLFVQNPQAPPSKHLPGWVLPAAGVGVGLLVLKFLL